LISKLLTDVSGSSAVFFGGVVSYANSAKQNLLGVSETTLKKSGAVSAECAAEMLRGAAGKFQVPCAISVTGIAGPDGGTPEKPVGLVFIGVKCFDQVLVKEYHFRGSRAQVRERTAAVALNTLRRMLLGEHLS
jgi:nicotinamide-nucleotide amidase